MATSLNSKCSVCLTVIEDSKCNSKLSCNHHMCQRCIRSLSVEETVICTLCWEISLLCTNMERQVMSTTPGQNNCSSSGAESQLTTFESKFSEISINVVMNNGNMKEMTNVFTDQVDDIKTVVKNHLKDSLTKKKLSRKEITAIVTRINDSFGEETVLCRELELRQRDDIRHSGRRDFSGNILPKFSCHKEPKTFFEAKIVSTPSPYKVYLQIVDDDLRRLRFLNQELQTEFQHFETLTKKTSVKHSSKGIGYAVCLDGVWHRAVLEERNDVKGYKFMCIDTGRRSYVDSQCVRRLPSRYLELPAQAVLCKLRCVAPLELTTRTDKFRAYPRALVNYSWWPIEAVNVLRRKENKIVRVFVHQFEPSRLGNTPHVREARLLTTMYVKDEMTSINQQVDDALMKVLKKGQGHPYNDVLLKACKSALGKTPKLEVLAPTKHLVPTTRHDSVRNEENMILTVTSTSNASTTSKAGSTSTGHGRICRLVPNVKTMRVKLWDFPEPNTSLTPCFRGVVTWVDNRGGIYLHDEKWSKQLLVIRDTFSASFNQTEPSLYDLRCQPGDPCIAKFNGDWFRAIVKAVSERKSIVSVYLIDYGVIENVACYNIRRDVILTEIPIQTFRCSLHNTKPVEENGSNVNSNWSNDVIDCLHEVAVNQEFNVKVQTYSPLNVSLQFSKNSVDLSDFLVAAGKADYIVKPSV